MTIDKPLPLRAELEQEVLALLTIADDEEIKQALEELTEPDFYRNVNRTIFLTMLKLHKNNNPLDPLTVSDALPDSLRSDFQAIEQMSVVTTAMLPKKIQQLKETTLKRAGIENLNKSSDKLYSMEYDGKETINELIENLVKISGEIRIKPEFTTKDTIRDTMTFIQQAKGENDPYSVKYCLPCVDAKITHLRRQMHVLSAFSGIGKTAFALTCMRFQIFNNVKSVFFCGESSRVELMIRLACIISGLSFDQITVGINNIKQNDLNAFQSAMARLTEYSNNFWIYGKGDYEHSCTDIDRIVSKIKKKNKLDMVYVDYLQNMKPFRYLEKEPRYLQVEKNIMALNDIFGEHDIAGVVMSQLNRETQGRPRMTNLKYSSTIENEAHIISFLHREEKPDDVNQEWLETEWYSDKTRIIKPFATKLSFRTRNAEYCGTYAKDCEQMKNQR